MSDLNALFHFARDKQHNLTGPVRHVQVEQLATAWLPNIFFHEEERFHPIDLQALLRIPPDVFASLPEAVRDSFRVTVQTATLSNGQPLTQRFDPPVVHVESGDARRVLGSGLGARQALADLDVNGDAVYTHGARQDASREFFGASDTVHSAPVPAAGDPRLPRHSIVVRAELRMLLQALKHELQLEDLSGPTDAIWSGFAVEGSFFREQINGTENTQAFPRLQQRALLADLVKAHESGNQPEVARLLSEEIPQGWAFVQKAWDAVLQYAFLEYHLIYAFNDYAEYGDWPFANEHEGDVEGFCLVFERSALDNLAAGAVSADTVVPHTVITSVHNEFNHNDDIKRLPLVPDAAHADLNLYVAAGSHATYLTAGNHDVLSFQDVLIDLPGELPSWAVLLATLGNPAILPVLALVAAIVEHFVDSEDQTSANGVSVGPGESDPANLQFGKSIEVTPLSSFETDFNIYQERFLAARALRGFPGTWGGSDGLLNFSSRWENKTARYFRRFLEFGDIRPTVVIA